MKLIPLISLSFFYLSESLSNLSWTTRDTEHLHHFHEWFEGSHYCSSTAFFFSRFYFWLSVRTRYLTLSWWMWMHFPCLQQSQLWYHPRAANRFVCRQRVLYNGMNLFMTLSYRSQARQKVWRCAFALLLSGQSLDLWQQFRGFIVPYYQSIWLLSRGWFPRSNILPHLKGDWAKLTGIFFGQISVLEEVFIGNQYHRQFVNPFVLLSVKSGWLYPWSFMLEIQ